ncbi:THAP domain-containing protein 11 [Anolis sagrei]|uniref:THAP domain-containing protein 11 n=1 Tax=Anolis sagrei TaxID=38937 RepID=UPI0035214DE4
MPGFTCCVPGCYNNSHRDKALHFYTFPKDAELRRLWLKNVSRAGVSGCFSTFQPTTGHRVCSEHFPGGRKSYLVRVPTIFPLRGVNERKAGRGGGGGGGGRRPGPRGHAPLHPSSAAAQAAAQAAVLLTLQEAGTGGGAATGSGGEAALRAGMGAEDVKPMDLTVQLELGGTAAAAAAAAAAALVSPMSLASFLAQNGGALAGGGSPGGEGGPPDHSYSLSSGTTSEELLRKLNEQRDIIALLEVKMKEMKGSIRRLRLAEAQLREEVREKDRLLHAATLGGSGGSSSAHRKRHGL